MPFLEYRLALEVAGKVKAYLNLQTGLVRGNLPVEREPVEKTFAEGGPLQDQLREQLRKKDKRIGELERILDSSRPRLEPERLFFIFGSARSGTTWLRDMMSELPEHRAWEEPRVGELFGEFYEKSGPRKLGAKNFIISERYREVWLRSLREMVLDGATARFPELLEGGHLVIKEPNGSVGAPLLSDALPESSMVCVVRDPRDACASVLDGAKQGGWHFERVNDAAQWKIQREADLDPDTFVRRLADHYLRNAGGALKAYRSHKGPKILIRYEELNADPLGTMRRILSTLGARVGEEELVRVVEKYSWENIPEEKRGQGKFFRKATPGAWKEDLTPKEVAIVEEITTPLLNEFYDSRHSEPGS